MGEHLPPLLVGQRHRKSAEAIHTYRVWFRDLIRQRADAFAYPDVEGREASRPHLLLRFGSRARRQRFRSGTAQWHNRETVSFPQELRRIRAGARRGNRFLQFRAQAGEFFEEPGDILLD